MPVYKTYRANVLPDLVPYSRNPDFVGRTDILDMLKGQFRYTRQTSDNSQPRVSLCGLGGVGYVFFFYLLIYVQRLTCRRKTQIALAYVYWLQETFPAVSIFWVYASSAETFRRSYASIAVAYRIPGYTDPEVDVLPLVKDWLETKTYRHWLMVLDNADDTELFINQPLGTVSSSAVPESTKHLADYLPDCAHGALLITTRNESMGVRLTKGQLLIEVPHMSGDESERFLRTRFEGIDATSDDLLSLSARLDHLPLALGQAAAFMQEMSITVDVYLQLLNESNQITKDILMDDSQTVGQNSEISGAVTQTWILSFQQLEQQDNLAGELLSFMSLFDRQDIPEKLIFHYGEQKRGEWDRLRIIKALGTLMEFSFVARNISGNFEMHHHVQLLTHRWLTNRRTIGRFRREALMAISSLYPYGTFETRATCVALLPHANSVLGSGGFLSRDEAKAKASLLHCMASYFGFEGKWSHAERLSLEAYEIQNKLWGEDHPSTLKSMADLASIYKNQGRWDEAEDLSIQAVTTLRMVLGEEHPYTLTSMANLALIYTHQGHWDNAKDLSIKVMDIRREVLGAEHPDTLTSMANLASIYRNQGRWDEAKDLGEQVIKIREGVLGAEHPDTLISMADLVLIFKNLGQWNEAMKLGVQVIKIRERIFGKEHPDTRRSINDLDSIIGSLGRQGEAELLQVERTERTKWMIGVQHHPSMPDSRLMNPDHDSAYASASRVATLQAPSEPVFEDVATLPTAQRHDETGSLFDEIHSLASDDDDIGSLASDETTNEGMTGKALIRVFLAEEPQFRALCEKALVKLGRRRFVENMRRLLKSFYKSLSEEAQNEAEKAVARLLRSRRGRLRISYQLAVYMQQEEACGSDRADLEINLENKHRLENWVALGAGRQVGPEQELNTDDESFTSSSDDDDDFPLTSKLDVFLRESKSFRRLQQDFMLMFLPADLRHILLSIPKKHIWLSQEQDLSLSNSVKNWVEDNTRVRWNWWPLKSRKRLLQHGEARVLWQCVSLKL